MPIIKKDRETAERMIKGAWNSKLQTRCLFYVQKEEHEKEYSDNYHKADTALRCFFRNWKSDCTNARY